MTKSNDSLSEGEVINTPQRIVVNSLQDENENCDVFNENASTSETDLGSRNVFSMKSIAC